MISHRILF